MSRHGPVKMWEEETVIPTYPVGEPIKHPMFLEKRVYQGSSGGVPVSRHRQDLGEKEDRRTTRLAGKRLFESGHHAGAGRAYLSP